MSKSTTLMPDAAKSGTSTIGKDLTVHRLGFGAMRITGKGIWGAPKDPAEAVKVLKRALELGINFIDTADAYGPETSENLIAEALHPYPKGLVIATKGGLTRQGPDSWKPVGRPEYLQQCVELSLRRLRVDCIDLWQLHRIDPQVPVEDSLGAITELQKAGKVRHIGLSEVSVKEIERAGKTAKIVSVQNLYNIGDRKHDDVVDYCAKNQIAFIPWFPMGGGDVFKPGNPLDRVAKRHGASISQVALAWLLHRSPCILPIPGTSSVGHLEENTAAASLEISADEWKEIERSA
jgi:aryl-alcohol dehydrogenase-like predicted oxidoreductase